MRYHFIKLKIYGLDYSKEMLEACEKKDIAVDLRQFDFNGTPLPYQTNYFDHVSANAVIYFILQLDILFSEISRILKKAGIWAFIVEENVTQRQSKFIEKPKEKNGLLNY